VRRKYKLIIIILISALLAYGIYFVSKEDKLKIVALGDGISSGQTSFNIDGISFNDYLKDYYESKKLLKYFNTNYSYKNYKISDLINDMKINALVKNEKIYINQMLHKSDVITLAIGEEELVKLSITNDLDNEVLKKLIVEYDNLLFMLKKITDAKIILIGFYENKYLDKSKIIILNSEISNIAIKYDCIFINISDLMLNNDYYIDNKSYYFNYKGHKKIAEMIIHSL